MACKLNKSELAILGFLLDYPHPYAPMLEEIANSTGLKVSTVCNYIRGLEAKGFVEKPYMRSRSIRILIRKCDLVRLEAAAAVQ